MEEVEEVATASWYLAEYFVSLIEKLADDLFTHAALMVTPECSGYLQSTAYTRFSPARMSAAWEVGVESGLDPG